MFRLSAATLALSLISAVAALATDGERTDTKSEGGGVERMVLDTQERLKNRSLYFRGERIFDQMCVQCHGTTGRGNGPWATDMVNKPRNLRVGTFKFRTTPYGKLPTTGDLRRTIRSGISGTAMPSFSKFSDAEIDGIVTFVQSLSRRWKDGEQFAEPLDLPEPPDWLKNETASQEHARSAEIHFEKLCSSCHGAGGKGDGAASKGLVDVWENPIAPADLTKPHFKGGDEPKDVYRTIATGLDGTPMIGFHGVLKPGQIWNVVALIRGRQVAPEKP